MILGQITLLKIVYISESFSLLLKSKKQIVINSYEHLLFRKWFGTFFGDLSHWKNFWDYAMFKKICSKNKPPLKERKDVVQCYHCGIMLPRDEMFLHMEEHHVKFYSHMCGPARPYQCSVCRRTMETEKQHAGHRYFF